MGEFQDTIDLNDNNNFEDRRLNLGQGERFIVEHLRASLFIIDCKINTIKGNQPIEEKS